MKLTYTITTELPNEGLFFGVKHGQPWFIDSLEEFFHIEITPAQVKAITKRYEALKENEYLLIDQVSQ